MLNPWGLLAGVLFLVATFVGGFSAGVRYEGAKAEKAEAVRLADLEKRNATARAAEVEAAKRDYQRQERAYAEFQSLSARARRVGGSRIIVTPAFASVWNDAARAANSPELAPGGDEADRIPPAAAAEESTEDFALAYDPADIAEWNVAAAHAFTLRSLQLEACVERYKIMQTQCNAPQAEN